jgi:hypothetical protein
LTDRHRLLATNHLCEILYFTLHNRLHYIFGNLKLPQRLCLFVGRIFITQKLIERLLDLPLIRVFFIQFFDNGCDILRLMLVYRLFEVYLER